MRKFYMSLPFLVLLPMLLSGAELKNGAFEDIKEGRISGWYPSDKGFFQAARDDRQNGTVIKLTSSADSKITTRPNWNRGLFLYQNLSVKPDTYYTLNCRFRSEIKQGSAGIAVQWQGMGKESIMAERIPLKFLPVTGNEKEWKNLSFTFKTPAKCSSLRVMAAAEDLNGTIWYDDFTLNEEFFTPNIPLVSGTPDWSKAFVAEGFLELGTSSERRKAANPHTRISFLADKKSLLVKGVCFEPEMNMIAANEKLRDGKVWQDDCVEIFIDAQRSGNSWYQICINANGAVFDACGRDISWSPELNSKSVKFPDRWEFEFSVPFTSLGYGQVEAEVPDKPMALGLFRNRKLSGQSKARRMSWQFWPFSGYQHPEHFQWVSVGTGDRSGRCDFLYRGFHNTEAPSLAWKVAEPLYEELMTDEMLHPSAGDVGICYIGRLLNLNAGNNITAFAIQHGMEYTVNELLSLCREMRIPISKYGFDRLAAADKKKYYAIASQHDGGRYYFHAFDPNCPGFKKGKVKAYLYPDERVAASVEKHVLETLKHEKEWISMYVLGHESRALYFIWYDAIREAYLQEEPEQWRQWDEEARRDYGGGKHGFPKSRTDATPFERIVWQRWVTDRYNKFTADLILKMRAIAPEVKIVSEVDVNGVNPFGYERYSPGFDFVTQQMYWGHGRNRQSAAFNVKVLLDLYGIPVLGGPHVERYYVSLSAEDFNEVLSSVFRVGGSGLFLWLIDWNGNTHSDYFGAPERMREAVSIYKKYSTMRKLRFPEPDSAILFSNLTQFGNGWFCVGGVDGGHEKIFTLLGPHVGAWFKFISDYNIADGREDLSKFKVIYVPSAHYTDDKTFSALEKYVHDGGILVSFDPENFRFTPDGGERRLESFIGAEPQGKLDIFSNAKFTKAGGFKNLAGLKTLRFSSRNAVKFLPNPGTHVLAKSPQDIPLIICNSHGKGRIITFAGNALSDEIYQDNSWRMFTEALQKDAGCQTSQNIWRFRFPLATNEPEKDFFPENSLCLTGNAYRWKNERPQEGNNGKIPFSYTYSNTPDLIPDPPAKTPQAGKLFNRARSLEAAPALKITREKSFQDLVAPWCAAWKNTLPAKISLRFRKAVAADRLRLWVHGNIPSIEIGAIDENGQYTRSAVWQPEQGGNSYESIDVRRIDISFPSQESNVFEIRLGDRKGDFYLSEVELWGGVELNKVAGAVRNSVD